MKILLSIFTLLGSLGLFMYGMRIMSEALQRSAGIGLRKNLAAITKNKPRGILSGAFITGGLQSSSAITIMVISFVNAGLLSLSESASLIMGANIGTTLTAWMISIFGFKFNISTFTLPLIGICFPFYFSRNNKIKYWSEFFIGFALVFIGLDFIKNVFPDIHSNPELFDLISGLTNHGYFSIILFVIFGFIITAIIQSSSVATALTLVISAKGLIGFEYAAAMIIGENIGTTITAFIASFMANNESRKAAVFHILFNLTGLIWVLPLFRLITGGIDKIMLFFTGTSPYYEAIAIPTALALFHSLFNIIHTVLIYGVSEHLLKLTGKLIIREKDDNNQSDLKYISSGFLSTSELSLIQANGKIKSFAEQTDTMYRNLKKLFFEINEDEFFRLIEEMKSLVKQGEETKQSITNYITRLSDSDLSLESVYRIRSMAKLVDEIANISSVLFNISKTLKRKKKKKIWFTQDLRNNINHMFILLDEAFIKMLENLSGEYENADTEYPQTIEKKINKYAKELQKKYMTEHKTKEYKHEAGVIYNEIFNKCERLGDFVFNVSKTLGELKN